jgi:hypothetical protein
VKTMNPALWYVLQCGHVRPNPQSWWDSRSPTFMVWGPWSGGKCVHMICQQTYPDNAFQKTQDTER